MRLLKHAYYAEVNDQDCFCAIGLLAHTAGVSIDELKKNSDTPISHLAGIKDVIESKYDLSNVAKGTWFELVQGANDLGNENSLRHAFEAVGLSGMLGDEEIEFIALNS